MPTVGQILTTQADAFPEPAAGWAASNTTPNDALENALLFFPNKEDIWFQAVELVKYTKPDWQGYKIAPVAIKIFNILNNGG